MGTVKQTPLWDSIARYILAIVLLFLMVLMFMQTATAAVHNSPAGFPPAVAVTDVIEKYGIESGDFNLIQSGRWFFCSQNSITVAFQTSERCHGELKLFKEGGQETKYTKPGPTSIHIFTIGGLEADHNYSVAFKAYDSLMQRSITTGPHPTPTATISGAVLVPDDLPGGPPYILDEADKYYLLTQDIISDTTAIVLTGSSSTFDLNGHQITYNNKRYAIPTNEWTPHREYSAFGIKMRNAGENICIYNGYIEQGAGLDTASYVTIGSNPIYISGGADFEAAGLHIAYGGVQVSGIICHWPGQGYYLHHNELEDHGKYILNRHQQVTAIKAAASRRARIQNNLIRRTRQCGIGCSGPEAIISGNEIYVDSYSINSFAVTTGDSCKVLNNKLYGHGNNAYGVATTGACTDTEVSGNLIWLQSHRMDEYEPWLNPTEMEHADISTMSAVRITWGGTNISYHDNTILVSNRDGGIGRGTFFYADDDVSGCSFKDNFVAVIDEDGQSDQWGAIAGVGNHSASECPPIIFSSNIIVSNFCNYSMKDSYGYSMNYLFEDNLFVKTGEHSNYNTIRSGEGYSSHGARFIDTRFEGGASFGSALMSNYSEDDFNVAWSLTLKTPGKKNVVISDKDDNLVFSGEIDSTMIIVLDEYFRVQQDIQEFAPYTVMAEYYGETETRTVTMDSATTLYLYDDIGIYRNREDTSKLFCYCKSGYIFFRLSDCMYEPQEVFITDINGRILSGSVPLKLSNNYYRLSDKINVSGAYSITIRTESEIISVIVYITDL